MGITPQEIQNLVESAIAPSQVRAIDMKGTQDHYRVVVVSEKFSGLPLIKRHQMVNDALSEPLKGPLHALTIETLTPDELAAKQGQKASPAPAPNMQMPQKIKL